MNRGKFYKRSVAGGRVGVLVALSAFAAPFQSARGLWAVLHPASSGFLQFARVAHLTRGCRGMGEERSRAWCTGAQAAGHHRVSPG